MSHPFQWDRDIPRDGYGRRYCSVCHLPGEPGDHRHADVDAPTPDALYVEAAAEVEAARLAEGARR